MHGKAPTRTYIYKDLGSLVNLSKFHTVGNLFSFLGGGVMVEIEVEGLDGLREALEAVERAARLGDGWLCGPVQSLAKANSCLDVYRSACAAARPRRSDTRTMFAIPAALGAMSSGERSPSSRGVTSGSNCSEPLAGRPSMQ